VPTSGILDTQIFIRRHGQFAFCAGFTCHPPLGCFASSARQTGTAIDEPLNGRCGRWRQGVEGFGRLRFSKGWLIFNDEESSELPGNLHEIVRAGGRLAQLVFAQRWSSAGH
jgi:hypothetical protein